MSTRIADAAEMLMDRLDSLTPDEAGRWARNIAHMARVEARARARRRIAAKIRADIYRDAGLTRSRFGGWE